MGRTRLSRVALISLCLLGASLVAASYAYRTAKRDYVESAHDLEELAAKRYEHARGLSPCEPSDRETIEGLWSYLHRFGEPRPDIVALIAPSFSEVVLVAFGPKQVTSYRLKGHPGPGFGPPPRGWLQSEPQVISEFRLGLEEYSLISSALERHTTYAMTAREYGKDGVTYYVGVGTDGCAMAWTPRGGGPADLIAQILAESSLAKPSEVRLTELARKIEAVDRER